MFPLSVFSKTSSTKPDSAVAVERLESENRTACLKSKLLYLNPEVFVEQEVDYPGSRLENSALTAGTGYLVQEEATHHREEGGRIGSGLTVTAGEAENY